MPSGGGLGVGGGGRKYPLLGSFSLFVQCAFESFASVLLVVHLHQEFCVPYNIGNTIETSPAGP